jgi:DNA-binding XRE family transcriptional regulator
MTARPRSSCASGFGNWSHQMAIAHDCIPMREPSFRHDAHDYAERIRERLPRRLQELRERCGLSKYGLARESGVSREYIGKIERGKANPTLPVTAQISHGLGMTLEQFTGELEDDTE